MDSINLMISITNREELKDLAEIYREYGVTTSFISLGRGTAVLNSALKAVTFSMVTGINWVYIRHALEKKMKIDLPDRGIVFTIPLSSFGGMRQLTALLGKQEYEREEESVLKNTKYELVIVVANTGYSDQIMTAARAGGARGGTVIHAKGTGAGGSQEFLGITLAGEKEMVFTVVRTEAKNDVMKKIMEDCGIGTAVNAVVMSLPVTATAGMRFYEMNEAVQEVEDGEQFAGQIERENS